MIRAHNGNLLLKKVEDQETMYGNIVVPDLGHEKPELGEVIDMSDTYNWHTGKYISTSVQKGDIVVIPKMGSMLVSYEGQDYILVKETDVLAIIKK
jgi:chaperonin GroES